MTIIDFSQLEKIADRTTRIQICSIIGERLANDSAELLHLIIKYDCKPSDIAEIIREPDLGNHPLFIRRKIVDIKLKSKELKNGD